MPAPYVAPPPLPPLNLGDTNQQSVRADLRNQGYFIDNSGVYAPGAGQRVGATWSGQNVNRNEAPSPTQLPVLNGTPVSPSNGFTGDQTEAIMYRGDPLYSQFFGPDTPGYSSTSRTYNATAGALPNGQSTIQSLWAQNGQSASGVPTTAPLPATTPANAPESQPAGANPNATNDQNAWMAGITAPSQSGYGFGPYATPEAPTLTPAGAPYEDNGNLVQKSTDQFGHEYYHTVGQAQPATAPAPARPPAATTQPAAPAAPAADDPTKGGTLVPLLTGDGKVLYVPQAIYDAHKADIDAQAAAAAKAIAFTQGIEQQKVDISRLVAQYQQTYNEALIAGQSAQLAQQMAIAQMQNDLAKQAQELQRQQQAQTLSFQRDQLQAQRQQQRGNRRSVGVRYR